MLIIPQRPKAVPPPGTFSRPSPAYDYRNVLVPSGRPRFARLDGMPGVLVEEGATNLTPYSDPTDITKFSPRGDVTRASGIAPFLAGGAEFIDNATTRFAYQAHNTLTPNTQYAFSFFIRMTDGGVPLKATDFTLMFASLAVPSDAIKVVSLGDGLYRVEAVLTTLATLNGYNCGVVKYPGQSVRGFKVSGYQVEQKAFVTSYQPTNGAPVARSPEVLTLPTAGILSPAQGYIRMWVYVNALVKRTSGAARLFRVNRADGGYAFTVNHSTSGFWFLTSFDDTNATTGAPGYPDANTPEGWHLFEAKWNAANLRLMVDGVVGGAAINPKLPTALHSLWHIGSANGTSEFANTYFGATQCGSNYPTDAESLAAYNAGGILPDANTTLVWRPKGRRIIL
jgi:hypothetical protein